MNWMDLCIIMIILLNGFIGLNMGFILSLFSIGSYIFAFIAAKLYYPYLSKYVLENTNLIPKIQGYVFNKITEPGNIASSQPGSSENLFEILNFPKSLENLLLKSAAVKEYSDGVMAGIHGYVSEVVTRVILDLVCIILIFFVAKLLLNIIGRLLDSIATLPVIKQFNSLGGFVFGLGKGILIVFLITALLVPAVSIFNGSFIAEGLNKSILAEFFYDHNLILGMIGFLFDPI